MVLIAQPFQSIHEFVQVAQGMKRVIRYISRSRNEQSQTIQVERKDLVYFMPCLLFQKKGKSERSYQQFQRKGNFAIKRRYEGYKQVNSGGFSKGSTQQKTILQKVLLNRKVQCSYYMRGVAQDTLETILQHQIGIRFAKKRDIVQRDCLYLNR